MPTEVTERWQNKVTNLKDAIQKVHENKEFSDVTFTVGHKKFKAHKLILSARCSEFFRILFDPNAIDDIVVEDENVTETGFEILLRFIYTDKLGTDDKQSIVKAYLAANVYKQKKLKETCEEHIESWHISVEEVCELLNVSLGIPKLKEKCLHFIKNNAIDVISSPTFFNLSYQSLVSILENDALKDVELQDRIKKVIEWGARLHTSPIDYALVREDFLNQNPPLLGMLKIEELTLENFSQLFTVEYPEFLNAIEIVKLMNYIATKKEESLPSWCAKKK